VPAVGIVIILIGLWFLIRTATGSLPRVIARTSG
jgi:hypothetical protein